MRPTQRPTATNVRVRSTRDANTLFHAVALGILPIVSRRLDAADRAALRPGCVYVWEERSPGSLGGGAEGVGMGMERFTEGRHWYPSRVRDDFLLYVEKDWELNEHRPSKHGAASSGSHPRRQPLVKQTYSAWVNTGKTLKKWHMNAYYTEDSLEHLLSVDDIPVLAGLHVPHDCYQRARASGSSSSTASSNSKKASTSGFVMDNDKRGSVSGGGGKERLSVTTSTLPNAAHRYAPFPPSPVSSSASSPRGSSRGRTSPQGGRVSPLNARTNGNIYRTAYSYPPPPPPAPLSTNTVPALHPAPPQSHSPPYHYPPHDVQAIEPRPAHHHHNGLSLPPLCVPSQMQYSGHPLSASSSATSSSSSYSSSPSHIPRLSYSATSSTATPTPTTASPYAHTYPLPPPPPSSFSSSSPSPSSSSYSHSLLMDASPDGTISPLPRCEYSSGVREKERDERTLVPLHALRLSDPTAGNGPSAIGGKKRDKADEEALRAFRSF